MTVSNDPVPPGSPVTAASHMSLTRYTSLGISLGSTEVESHFYTSFLLPWFELGLDGCASLEAECTTTSFPCLGVYACPYAQCFQVRFYYTWTVFSTDFKIPCFPPWSLPKTHVDNLLHVLSLSLCLNHNGPMHRYKHACRSHLIPAYCVFLSLLPMGQWTPS